MIGLIFLLAVFLSVVISLVIIKYISNELGIELINSGRFTAIDGLRAYLSLFVFFITFLFFINGKNLVNGKSQKFYLLMI